VTPEDSEIMQKRDNTLYKFCFNILKNIYEAMAAVRQEQAAMKREIS
jgi:hypothetical protein